MRYARRSRIGPVVTVLVFSLLFSVVIIPRASACTPPDTPFNVDSRGSYLLEGVRLTATVRLGAAALCASSSGLAVLNVSDPLSPSVVTTRAAGGAVGLDIDVADGFAWVAASDGRVYVYDVSDPFAPVAEGSVLLGTDVYAVDARGDRLYIGASDGVHVFDISAAPTATEVGFYATLEPVTDVLAIGDVLYIGYSYYSVAALAEMTPQCYPTTVVALGVAGDTPVVLDSHQVPYGDVRLAVSGDGTTLFTAISFPGGGSYLKVFDISVPGALNYLVALDTGKGGAIDIAVSGDMVLLGGMFDMRLYNMSEPLVGYLAGFSPDGGSAVTWADDAGSTFYAVDPVDGSLDVYAYAPVSERSLGPTRYETAVDLNDEFVTSEYVVLATGGNFPDALSAAPLAYALNAPVLLVEKGSIPSAVKKKITDLGATKAYVLGSTNAVGTTIQTQLQGLGMLPGNIKRLGGASRYDTAAAIALELKAIKGGAPIKTAFIATGETFPDALAASAIAAKMGAPVLLVTKNSIPQVTAYALSALGVTDTVVLGGGNAVSGAVFAALPSPVRLEGADRYGTAKAIADWALDSSGGGFVADELFVVTGLNFPDAMPCGVVAANHDAVMVLVNGDVPAATQAFLAARKSSIANVRIVGGTGAVSSDVERVVVGLLK